MKLKLVRNILILLLSVVGLGIGTSAADAQEPPPLGCWWMGVDPADDGVLWLGCYDAENDQVNYYTCVDYGGTLWCIEPDSAGVASVGQLRGLRLERSNWDQSPPADVRTSEFATMPRRIERDVPSARFFPFRRQPNELA